MHHSAFDNTLKDMGIIDACCDPDVPGSLANTYDLLSALRAYHACPRAIQPSFTGNFDGRT